jgi:hypothetical protein
LLTLYFSTTVILGIARVRTLWLPAAHSAVSALMVTSFVLTSVALLYEAAEKRDELIAIPNPGKAPCAPEEVSGFWIRACFTWLVSTFRLGYSRIISVNDLPPLDSKLHSATLGDTLRSKWKKRENAHSQPGFMGQSNLLRQVDTGPATSSFGDLLSATLNPASHHCGHVE